MSEQLVGMQILGVHPLLQARIVLLDFVSIHTIIEEKSEVRIQIEQRASEKTIQFQDVAVRKFPLVVRSQRAQTDPSAIKRIDEAEAIQLAAGYKVQRDLP